ncbi:hypothetical protein [Kordia sp.]|uniref:hypothetical protein n=1 Tax=Kordia sp. TaxID=1965332 RepID=UPI003D265CE7
MKKRNLKGLSLNKKIISGFKNNVYGGGTDGCQSNLFGQCSQVDLTDWLGCGSGDACNNTGSFHCPTSAAICDHLCPSDV